MSLSVSVFSPEERSSADVDENYSKRERDWGSLPMVHEALASVPGCNAMPPLAAFPMHYYPATDTTKSCRPEQPNLAA
jgi:hypothetical protein